MTIRKKCTKKLTNILCEIEDNLDDTFESDIRYKHYTPRKDYSLNDPFLYFRRYNKKEGEVFLDDKFSHHLY